VVMYMFDATKGGAPVRTLPIVDASDTEDRPEDAPENFLLARVRPRLEVVRAVLRDKRWAPLDETGLNLTFEDGKLGVADASGRTLRSHAYDAIGSGNSGNLNACVFEPWAAKAYSDARRHFLLVRVSYRSGPDWCNMDDELELFVL
jgi:hypothetical protein